VSSKATRFFFSGGDEEPQSRDVTVSFQLFNVGTSAAVDVELNENGFAKVSVGTELKCRVF
jgi:hypothetical protein